MTPIRREDHDLLELLTMNRVQCRGSRDSKGRTWNRKIDLCGKKAKFRTFAAANSRETYAELQRRQGKT